LERLNQQAVRLSLLRVIVNACKIEEQQMAAGAAWQPSRGENPSLLEGASRQVVDEQKQLKDLAKTSAKACEEKNSTNALSVLASTGALPIRGVQAYEWVLRAEGTIYFVNETAASRKH